MAAKHIEAQLANSLNTRREGKSQEVGEAKHGLGIAMCVGRVDVALDDIVVH
jgi:hypothetical protein